MIMFSLKRATSTVARINLACIMSCTAASQARPKPVYLLSISYTLRTYGRPNSSNTATPCWISQRVRCSIALKYRLARGEARQEGQLGVVSGLEGANRIATVQHNKATSMATEIFRGEYTVVIRTEYGSYCQGGA